MFKNKSDVQRDFSTRGQLLLGCAICLIGAIFYCYEYLLRIIPGVIAFDLRIAFGHISATSFGTLSAYYYFAYTPMQIPVGMLMDSFGPRLLLPLACLLCAIGSAMFTYTDWFHVAALGRFLIGFGSAFAFVGVLSLAYLWLPKRYFSMMAGAITTLGMLGAIIGQMGITVIVKQMGWQFVLSIAAYLGFILTVIMFFCLREHPSQKKKTAAVDVNFWSDVGRVLLSYQIWLIGLVGSLFYLSLSVFAEMWGKSYLVVAYGLSELDSATAISMVFLGWAIGGPLMGFVTDWLSTHVLSLLLGALCAAACIATLLYVPQLSLFTIKLLLFLYGFFCSVEVVVFVLAKRNGCSAALSGTIFAVVNMIVMLSGVIFQPLVGHWLDTLWLGTMSGHTRIYSIQEFQLVLSLLPLGLVIAAILTFFINEPPLSAENSD